VNENALTEYDIALATTPTPDPTRSEAELIAGVLEDAGIVAPPALVFDLERLLHRMSYRMAGEALARLSLRLPRHSAAGVALARIIRGPEGESLREAGRGCGVSGVAILKAERRIQARLRLAVPPLVEHEHEFVRASSERGRPKTGQRSRR
jgi:hypothetical protein